MGGVERPLERKKESIFENWANDSWAIEIKVEEASKIRGCWLQQENSLS